MQLVNIVGPLDAYSETAQAVIKTECFHPENIRNVLRGFSHLLPYEDENPYRPLLKKAKELAALAGKDDAETDVDTGTDVAEMSERIDKLHQNTAEIDEKIQNIKNEIFEEEQVASQLDVLSETDCDISDLFKLEFIKFRFGKLAKTVYNRLSFVEDEKLFIFIPTSINTDCVWGMYFAAAENIEYVDSIFASLQFERKFLSSKIHGNPSEARRLLTEEIEESEKALKEAETHKKELLTEAKSYSGAVLRTVDLLNETEELKKFCGKTGKNFYMAGWVPSENIKDFEKTLGNIDIDGLKITKEKAASQGSSAPTKLKNPLIFRPFEMFVRMYGVPGYGEFDPTTIVALTYSLFFGIMFGDLGQGLCVSLIGLLAWKLKKLELGKIMIPIGIFSAGFGVVYDSVFGYEGVLSRLIFGEERELVFTPSNHMMPALGITIAIGVVFIAVAMIMNIINSFKRKDLENALFGPNGLAGLIFYCALIGGLVGPILGMFSDISFNLLSTPYIVGLLVVPAVIIFFRGPLADLCKGKKDWFPKKFGEYLMSNIFELFETFLSYCTNSLSFVRVGAFALSHASMMGVVFSLAGTVPAAAFGSGNLVVIVIGNLFVMALEGLIVGIQVLRLEFYELFSRFYGGNGVSYSPLKLRSNLNR